MLHQFPEIGIYKIALPTALGRYFIALQNVLYFKANNNEAVMYFIKHEGKPVCEMKVFMRLKEIESGLQSRGFLKIRRDYIINTYNVKLYNNKALTMCNDEVLYPARDMVRLVEAYLKERYYI